MNIVNLDGKELALVQITAQHVKVFLHWCSTFY